MTMRPLEDFSRSELAELAGVHDHRPRERPDRPGGGHSRSPHLDYATIAIEEWMGASPIYTRRMQRALGFAGGEDVATIFKGLQLDCGFAHQYMDVRYEVESPHKGRFWLESCGALLDVEPRGEDHRLHDVPHHRGPDLRRHRRRHEPPGADPTGPSSAPARVDGCRAPTL